MCRIGIVFALALVVLAPAARATWSIVVADTATGEVAVGSATCLGGADLRNIVPIVRVGIGAAAHQASVFLNFPNKGLTWLELKKETPPDVILQLIEEEFTNFKSLDEDSDAPELGSQPLELAPVAPPGDGGADAEDQDDGGGTRRGAER